MATAIDGISDQPGANPRLNPLARVTDGGGLDHNRLGRWVRLGLDHTRLSRRGRVIDQHRRRRHFALEEIIAAPIGIGIIGPIAALTRHDEPLPVALDLLSLRIRLVGPLNDVIARRRLIAKPNLKTRRRGCGRIAPLRRAMRIAQKKHRNGVTPPRIVGMQGLPLTSSYVRGQARKRG